MRGPLTGCLMFALLAPAATAQQSQEDVTVPQVSPAAEVSPIPRARVIRDAVTEAAEEEGQSASDAGTAASDPASDSGDDDTPGDGAQVRVVYGSQPSPQPGITSQAPTAEAADTADDDTVAANSNDPDWKQDRTRRFRRAPMRRERTGVEIAAPIVPIEIPDTDLMDGARLRQLDKMTGATETFDIAVGESRRIARLRIKLDACRAPDDNDTHGTMAFISIWDTKTEEAAPRFTGWMFADSPALSALDHPRYDLWVISCTTSSGAASASRE